MKRTAAIALTAVMAASGVASAPALADSGAAPVNAVAARPDKPRPAESGGRDSAATTGPLAIGVRVVDSTGVEIGHITRLTTDKLGRDVAQVRNGEDVYAIPVTDLFPRHGDVLSTLPLATVKRSYAGGP